MLLPKDVQEKTFPKSAFGGYKMDSVDDFLEELTQDYTELYRENVVLKEKLRVLVKKLEEYHDREQQSSAAPEQADDPAAAAEEKRLDAAKQTARHFIETIEQDVREHLQILETIKNRDLTVKSDPRTGAGEQSGASRSETASPDKSSTITFRAQEPELQFGENYTPTGK